MKRVECKSLLFLSLNKTQLSSQQRIPTNYIFFDTMENYFACMFAYEKMLVIEKYSRFNFICVFLL